MARKKKEEEAPATGPPLDAHATATVDPPPTLVTESPALTEASRPSEPAAPQGDAQKSQPVFRVGPIPTDGTHAVSAAVWENEVTLPDGRTFKVHNVTVESRYRDSSGEWKSTKGFRGSQLYAVIYAALLRISRKR